MSPLDFEITRVDCIINIVVSLSCIRIEKDIAIKINLKEKGNVERKCFYQDRTFQAENIQV